jgi:hypothetical protein
MRRLLAVLVVAALVAVAVFLLPTRGPVDGEGAREEHDPARAPGAAPALERPPDGAAPAEEARHEAGRIALRGRAVVRVLDAVDRTPIDGAEVWADFAIGGVLRKHTPGVNVGAHGKPLGGGRYEFRTMPVDRASRFDATAPGHLRGLVEIPPGRAAVGDEVVILLPRALSGEESSARVVLELDGDAGGLDLADGTLLLPDPAGHWTVRRLAEPIAMDPDPKGIQRVERPAEVLFPGFSAKLGTIVLERGKTTRLRVEVPPRFHFRIRLVTPNGVPVAGAKIVCGPDIEFGTARLKAAAVAATGADGAVVFPVRQRGWFRFDVEAPGHHVPSSSQWVEMKGRDAERVVTAVPLTPVRVEIDGPAPSPPFPVTLSFADATPSPAAVALLVAVAERRERGRVVDDYREALPRSASAAGGPEGRPSAAIGLLPGTYAMALRAGDFASLPETFEVGAVPVTVRAGLERLTVAPLTVVAPEVASKGVSPYAGALWIAHRAGFDERWTIGKKLAPWWHAEEGRTVFPPDALVRQTTSTVERARRDDPRMPPDVACVREDGTVDARCFPATREATLFLGSGRVAVVDFVPRPSGGRTVVEVRSSALRSVRLRFLDRAGGPWRGLVVRANPVADLARGIRDAAQSRRTDERGEVLVDALPGEEFGLYLGNEVVSVVEARDAVTRVERSGDRSFVAVRSEGEGAFVTLAKRD